MRHLALTGGIGSGKSTVAQFFADRGATIIDADAISRSLMEPGQQVLADVVATFGDHLLDEFGRLNRQALADIVFNDDDARHRLNALVHPAVREESKLQLKAAMEADPDNAVIIQDIPLLVETGQAEKFDGVIVVYTEMDTRLQRLVKARGMATDDARARIAAQATDEQRSAVADWLIDNSGSLENTEAQVAAVWEELRNPSTV
ncbi:dephospho-CoA kinase [Enteractinococcus helveticum]|uniref:Dephospho-CoA kinase n=1 Tax=Enteractinococcus helveticum TaxID=1837282 RepID=A0A1B7LXB4_9MICC|nr:dephospho-CoA kinase [Enteractinococcus helveticum]OAV59817.1 dephospho-CoA kinase [Enteractinococcus helveticum]